MTDNKQKVVAKLKELKKEYEDKSSNEYRKLGTYKYGKKLGKEIEDFLKADMNEYDMNTTAIAQVINIIKANDELAEEISFDDIEPAINELFLKAKDKYDELQVELEGYLSANRQAYSVRGVVERMKHQKNLMKQATIMERFAILAITEVMYG